MALSDIINSQISLQTQTPSKPGFGTPLIYAQTVPFADLYRIYASTASMVADGFDVNSPAYLAATVIKSQAASPVSFKVMKASSHVNHVVKVSVIDSGLQGGFRIGVPVGGTFNGTPVFYTPVSGDTAAIIAGHLQIPIEGAIEPSSTTIAAGVLTVTNTGAAAPVSRIQNTTALHIEDVTTAGNIAVDLSAMNNIDSDWYGLVLDINSAARITAAAAWVESNKKLFTPQTSDTDCEDVAVTSDIGSSLEALGYARTGLYFDATDNFGFLGAGIMALQFTAVPGSDTWAYKKVSGASTSRLAPTVRNALRTKKINFYVSESGLSITEGVNGGGGVSASGEYLDVTRFVDWLNAEIQVRTFQRFASLPKIPYTDKGIDILRAEVIGALKQGALQGGIVDSTFKVFATLAADQSAVDKGHRYYGGLSWSATLQGAIHTALIQGTLTL